MDKEYILKIPKDHSFAYISGGTYVMGGERNAALTYILKDAKRYKNIEKAKKAGYKFIKKCKNVSGFYVVDI